MRVILAAVIVAVMAGCAGSRHNVPEYGATFSELSHEVSALPPSPRKERIKDLLDSLETRIISSSRAGMSDAFVDNLTRLGEDMAPSELELAFATGARNWTGGTGDDGIELHLVPRDDVGSAIKTPGTIDAALIKESPVGFGIGETVLDRWAIPPDQLRTLWIASLFPAYVVRLPWHSGRPNVSTATLTVTFIPLYGQPLTVKKRIDIHSPAPANQPASPEEGAQPQIESTQNS